MATKTEICNMALSHLGVGVEISNILTDDTVEARTCRVFWPQAVRQTLRDFPWGVARRYVGLGLVEEDPNTEWGYSYRYPSDCLMPRRIISGVRNETRQSRVPYLLSSDDSGALIFTDEPEAVLEYTKDISGQEGLFDDDFSMAVSFRLAAYIAPKVCGDTFAMMRDSAIKFYQYELASARSNARNEEQNEEEPESELTRSRH